MSDAIAARVATNRMLSPYDFKLENQDLATGAVAYQGCGAAVDTSGKLVRASAATAVKTAGFFCATNASAAAGDQIDVQQGIGLFANGSAALTDADRFQPCYWEDDQTVGGNSSGLYAGLVVDVATEGVYVLLSPLLSLGAGANGQKIIAGGAAYTMKDEDAGAVIQTATDNAVVTLPAVTNANKGARITVQNTAATGAALVSISPAAADGIYGSVATAAADSTASGTDNQGFRNTKATAKKGDYVVLQSDGVNGWYIQGGYGVWVSF